MSIPKNIYRKHIISAFEYIDEHGTPKEREATKFYVKYQGKLYSPKYVISIANIFANGEELSAQAFGGGKNKTNTFLTKLGFIIQGNEADEKSNHLWSIVSPNVPFKLMEVLEQIAKAHKKPDSDLFYYLVGRTNNYDEVKRTFIQLKEMGFKPKKKHYLCILHLTETYEEANMIIGEMNRNKIKLDKDHYIALVAKTDTLEEGINLINRLNEKGISLNKAILKYRDIQNEDRKEYRQDLQKIYSEIPQRFLIIDNDDNGTNEFEDDVDDVNEYFEGKEAYRLHKFRERDSKLIKEVKQKFKQKHGELFCEACSINFEKKYGERGKDFIEAHHTKPVSEMKEGEKTRIEDIAMLCSNCHRMVHRKPLITVEELKTMINKLIY